MALVFPWLATKYRADVSGIVNLGNLESPVLFAMNHNAVKWDSVLVLKVLTRRWRQKIAFAAAAEITFGKAWLSVLASLVTNAFPLSRDKAIRQSLEYIGSLLDRGWSVGIFPEGIQLLDQDIQPFQSGTGLLAVECRTTVVPVHLVNEGLSSRRLLWFTHLEAISIRFRKPLTFSSETPYQEATQIIERAVRGL